MEDLALLRARVYERDKHDAGWWAHDRVSVAYVHDHACYHRRSGMWWLPLPNMAHDLCGNGMACGYATYYGNGEAEGHDHDHGNGNGNDYNYTYHYTCGNGYGNGADLGNPYGRGNGNGDFRGNGSGRTRPDPSTRWGPSALVIAVKDLAALEILRGEKSAQTR